MLHWCSLATMPSSLYEKRIPKKNTKVVRSELKALFKMTSLEAARTFKNQLVDKYSTLYSAMSETLDSGFEDSFQYCSMEETNYSRLKSTNMLEWVNEEIRRRQKLFEFFRMRPLHSD